MESLPRPWCGTSTLSAQSLTSARRPRSGISSRLFRTFGWQAVNHWQPTGHSQRSPADGYEAGVGPYRDSLCPAKPGGGGFCLVVRFDRFRLGLSGFNTPDRTFSKIDARATC